jgi:hypothetical protein
MDAEVGADGIADTVGVKVFVAVADDVSTPLDVGDSEGVSVDDHTVSVALGDSVLEAHDVAVGAATDADTDPEAELGGDAVAVAESVALAVTHPDADALREGETVTDGEGDVEIDAVDVTDTVVVVEDETVFVDDAVAVPVPVDETETDCEREATPPVCEIVADAVVEAETAALLGDCDVVVEPLLDSDGVDV